MRMARTKHVLNFKPIVQAEVPHGRNSKHRTIVTRILSDLDRLDAGASLKVPLSQLNDSKERVRSRCIARLGNAGVMLPLPAIGSSCTCGIERRSSSRLLSLLRAFSISARPSHTVHPGPRQDFLRSLATDVNLDLTRLRFFARRQAYGEHAISVLGRDLRGIDR